MGLASNFAQACMIATMFYAGIFGAGLLGISFGPLVQTLVGFIVIFGLSLAYTFYFRL